MKFTLVVEDHPEDCSVKAEFEPALELDKQPNTTAKLVAMAILAVITDMDCKKKLVALEGTDKAGKPVIKKKRAPSKKK